VHPAARLPRAWWFPDLEGFRSTETGTYVRYPLDEQPKVSAADDTLSWLEDVTERNDGIKDGEPGQQVRPLTTEQLTGLAPDLPLPQALRNFAERPELQRRISSVTACYLDLGDSLTPTSAPDGHLLHVLSDQQWVLHWLLYIDRAGNEAMVVSGDPIGFVLDENWEEPPPPVIPMDGTYDLDLCADSFAEFLYRFWIENELWWALERGESPGPGLAAYASQLPPADRST
jgi:hypothetical protein